MVLVFSVLWGCLSEPTPTLPPSQRQTWSPRGQMVAATGVRGYLVKPENPPAEGMLLLVNTVDSDTKTIAHNHAIEGFVVLAIPSEIKSEQAMSYLQGLSEVRGVSTTCLREDCP